MKGARGTLAVFCLFATITPTLGATAFAQPSSDLCPVFVGRVDALDDAGTRYAFGLLTYGGSGSASGTLAVYAADKRYSVPFTDAFVDDPTESTSRPRPLVVRFARPVTVSGAVVASLGAPAAPCPTPYLPWTANGRVAQFVGHQRLFYDAESDRHQESDAAVIDERQLWNGFDAAAANVAPVDAGDGVPAARCTQDDRGASVTHVERALIPAIVPAGPFAYRSAVLVTLDATGAVVAAATVVSAREDVPLDAAALTVAEHSSYRPARFRCAPAAGSYVFVLSYYRD
ncbi:MAG TPA: hypothetical protein VMD91_19840 [Candidatus Sulfotelmatobacter sp.]|nr:hypothetical protein [Candidatus Sulfotelmatobacter sp.]